MSYSERFVIYNYLITFLEYKIYIANTEQFVFSYAATKRSSQLESI